MKTGTLQWEQGFPVMKTRFFPVGISSQCRKLKQFAFASKISKTVFTNSVQNVFKYTYYNFLTKQNLTFKASTIWFINVFHLTWYCWEVFINQEISETMVQHGFNVCIHCTKAVTKGGLISEFFSILLKSSKNGNQITPLSTINLERTRTPLKPIWTDPSK